jgi:hypothetical protein
MNRLFSKPSAQIGNIPSGRFEKYFLTENPFPSTALLNKDSEQKKVNGSIYEPGIRELELSKVQRNFLQFPQSDSNHLRLGLISDSSFIGRGNGKTSFLINLVREINADYCLRLSNDVNKCFAIYLQPEAGGRTKTFDAFVDILFSALYGSGIIKSSLAILRANAIVKLQGSDQFLSNFPSEDVLIEKLNDANWYHNDAKDLLVNISKKDIAVEIFKSRHLQNISRDFPLYQEIQFMNSPLVTQNSFLEYYKSIGKGKAKLEFVFSDLVSFFLASEFNGSYIFVDDFERIPDHQSAIQKKDFVTQLRTVLYDGLYANARIGFFNFLFALHAGVPRILQDAWGLSGLEHRVSLNPVIEDPKHFVYFDKMNEVHAKLLIEKYLSEYRMENFDNDNRLFPFTLDAVKLIGITSEYNAAKILQLAYNIMEHVVKDGEDEITPEYVSKLLKESVANYGGGETINSISNTEPLDLNAKALNGE